MNRESEFRGKRTDNGQWMYGYLHVIDTYGRGYTGKAIQQQFGIARPYSVQAIKETIGEYTGLKDRDSNKIFEDDILDCGDRIVFVKWNKYCGQWDCEFIRYVGNKTSNGIENTEWQYRARVIGNIHDNPELLLEG